MDVNNQLTVIVPAFNEARSLLLLLPELVALCDAQNWNIIVVNDGSNDDTRKILGLYDDRARFGAIHHKLNRGYGAALKSGIQACDTTYAVTIDADGQHSLADIEKLLSMLLARDADMVVGSRQNTKTGSYYRGVGKFIIRALAKILMTVPIHDLNSGMKLYRTDLAKKYIYLAPDSMSYSDIITLVFINNRHLVLEIPITVEKRKHGKSTIGIDTAFQTIMEIINIMILFNPMKIFLPLSFVCFIISGFWGIPLLFKGMGVSIGSLLGIISGVIFFLLGLIAEQLSQIRKGQNQSS